MPTWRNQNSGYCCLSQLVQIQGAARGRGNLFRDAELGMEQSNAAKCRHGIGDWLAVGSSPGLGCTALYVGQVGWISSASVSSSAKWGQVQRACSVLGLTTNETKALFLCSNTLFAGRQTANNKGTSNSGMVLRKIRADY